MSPTEIKPGGRQTDLRQVYHSSRTGGGGTRRRVGVGDLILSLSLAFYIHERIDIGLDVKS